MTMTGIAERAGVTAGAVYYHFSSKDDLLAEIMRTTGEEVVLALSPEPDQSDLTAAFAQVSRVVDWAVSHRQLGHFYFGVSLGASPRVEEIRRANEVQLCHRWAAILVGPDPVETRVCALALLGLFGEIVASIVDPRRGDIDTPNSAWRNAGQVVVMRLLTDRWTSN
jgi:AcrR family transcriptional regulator